MKKSIGFVMLIGLIYVLFVGVDNTPNCGIWSEQILCKADIHIFEMEAILEKLEKEEEMNK